MADQKVPDPDRPGERTEQMEPVREGLAALNLAKRIPMPESELRSRRRGDR